MDRVPFAKRRCISRTPEQNALSLLSGVVQGEVPLTVRRTDTGIEMLGNESLVIAVPDHLARRAQLLHRAPPGVLKDVADLFGFWLKSEWAQSLKSKIQLVAREQPSDEDVTEAFELLKACNYLEDDVGVSKYSKVVHRFLLRAPEMATLPHIERMHITIATCTLPYRLLVELPEDLTRKVLHIGPLQVLARMPVGYPLANLCCTMYNDKVTNPDAPGAKHEALRRWTSSEDWIWISAVAHHAVTRIVVEATYSDWKQQIAGRYHGLHAFKVTVDKSETEGLNRDLPADLVSLHLKCGTQCRRGWRQLRLPDTLRHLLISFDLDEADAITDRLHLADLRMPSLLITLTVNTKYISLAGATLPPHLTNLTLHHHLCADNEEDDLQNEEDPLQLSALPLPPSIRQLALLCTLGPQGLDGVVLPPSLTRLALGGTGADPEAICALELPSGLVALQIVELNLDADSATGLQLPDGLRELDIAGEDSRVSMLRGMPVGLTQLRLTWFNFEEDRHEALRHDRLPSALKRLDLCTSQFGESAWLSRAALPRGLTALRLFQADLGAETLEAVPWPPTLRKLVVQEAESEEALVLNALPSTVSQLVLSDALLSFQDVVLPAALTSLDLGKSDLSDTLGDVTWPSTSSLRRLSLAHTDFGSAADLRKVRLPDSVTKLSLAGTELGRTRAELLSLPLSLRELDLDEANFGEGGLQTLDLPPQLTLLSMKGVELGPCGLAGVTLPSSLRYLNAQFDALESQCPVLASPWPSALRILLLRMSDVQLLERVCREVPSTLARLAICGSQADVTEVRGWLKGGSAVTVTVHSNDDVDFPLTGDDL